MSAREGRGPAYAAIVAQTLISAGTYLLGKVAVDQLNPLALCYLRFGGAALMLVLTARLTGADLSFRREELPLYLGLGFLVVMADPLLFLYGLRLSTASQISLLYPLNPIFVLLVARARGLEFPGWRRWLGILLSFFGVSLFIAESGLSYSLENLLGNLLVLGAVFSWSLYTTFSKTLVEKRGSLGALTISVITGMILFTPVGLPAALVADYSAVDWEGWLGLGYLIVITVVVGYFCYNYALSRLDASQVAVMANGQPVATVILAALILGETITPLFVIGGTIALAGVTLTQLSKGRRVVASAPATGPSP